LAKQKAKKSIREIARQLVEIYALRKHRKGYAFSRPDNYYREFEATFEHEETRDQIKTIDDVLSDMESEQPMDRLVCGDVGFGKTEVAIRAAFKAVMDGKQVALLVPTTVLAEQHYETFRKRVDPYQIKVGVLSRFKTKAEQKEVIAKVRSGRIDVLIGTHRILQKDIGFQDLGLLIIDEEQRFGVKQKETLKRYRALVDVLALTATPIPRTFHMSLVGIRDLSIIETPPEDRLAIQTYLSPYDKPTIIHAIEFELERGGQVFFVHNRVQTIENIANELMQLVPKARFAIAHGQMKERDLEETMIRFLQKEIDVLVCTTIIESGLDIPSANTIIINQADRFGLAQIYQLRGRVGRSEESAYAYLLLSGNSSLTREAEKRLRALMDFSHLGAGIQLAMHDLKIRGGGNILGFSQSGHISAIGYELYLKLIEQNVAELKGEEWHEEVNPEINVNMPAYLPNDYVSDTDVRLNLYRRLSILREESELETMVEEMHDRFGPPQQEVSNLLSVMSVRLLLKKVRVSRLDVGEGGLIFTLSPDTDMDPERLVKLVESKPKRFQFLSERKLKVKIVKQPPLEALLEAKRIAQEFDFSEPM
jgi:transcription-repair coupling factor (superfamily II helicase)